MEEYAALRKMTAKKKTAGNSEKPTFLKANMSWRELTHSSADLLSPREQTTGSETGVSVAICGHFLASYTDFYILKSREAVWTFSSNVLDYILWL